MVGKNNHNGENWPYHLYEGSKPELQGSYVPCATNPCSEHGGSEVYATSPDAACAKAHKNDSFGMSATNASTDNSSTDNGNDKITFLDKFKNAYSRTYDTDINVQGLAQKFDKSLDDPSFKKSVDDFVRQRGDYITSDREAAAFMLASGDEFLNKFYDAYSSTYNTDIDIQGLAQKFDKSLDDPSFKKSVDDFVMQRGDYISSDREAAAFMLASGLD